MLKCKDISNVSVMHAVDYVVNARGLQHLGANRWDIGLVLSGRAADVGKPELRQYREGLLADRLVLAKLRKLVRQGLLTGCVCGCRGDFLVNPEARMARHE